MGIDLTDGLYSVFYTNFLEIESELKSELGNNTAQQRLIKKTESVDFLFLDDLGTENLKAGSTTWMHSIIFDIIKPQVQFKQADRVFQQLHAGTADERV